MANICRGCFMFFGKREAILETLNTNFPPKNYYPLSHNASRIAHMKGDMRAPDGLFLQQLKGWMVTGMKDPEKRMQGEDALKWTTYDGEVSKRCIFNQNNLNETDTAFFENWLEGQVTERRETLRKMDLTRLLASQTEPTNLKQPSKLTADNIVDNVEKIIVQLHVLIDSPRLSLISDWSLRRLFNTDMIGHRGDLFRSGNVWVEYDDDYVLFSHTGDYGWWCPIDGLIPASVKHPDIYFGVAYLEEQGIFGQRLYQNGKELLKTIGPAGTLPDHCVKWVSEYGETYRSIQWGHTMKWQVQKVKDAMTNHVGISSTQLRQIGEDDNV